MQSHIRGMHYKGAYHSYTEKLAVHLFTQKIYFQTINSEDCDKSQWVCEGFKHNNSLFTFF